MMSCFRSLELQRCAKFFRCFADPFPALPSQARSVQHAAFLGTAAIPSKSSYAIVSFAIAHGKDLSR